MTALKYLRKIKVTTSDSVEYSGYVEPCNSFQDYRLYLKANDTTLRCILPLDTYPGSLQYVLNGIKYDPHFVAYLSKSADGSGLQDTGELERLLAEVFSSYAISRKGADEPLAPGYEVFTLIEIPKGEGRELLKAIKDYPVAEVFLSGTKRVIHAREVPGHAHLINELFKNCLIDAMKGLAKRNRYVLNDLYFLGLAVTPRVKTPAANLKQKLKEGMAHRAHLSDYDLNSIKSGRDEFSKMKLDTLKELASIEVVSAICRRFNEPKTQQSALRWNLRGLTVDQAIRKTEIIEEKASSAREMHLGMRG